MAENNTLRELFGSKKSELEQKLEDLVLPNVIHKVQQIVTDYLAAFFDSEGEFRQNLTRAEHYLLQATVSLLTDQQEKSKTFVNQKIRFNTIHEKLMDGVIKVVSDNSSSKKKYQGYLGTSTLQQNTRLY